MPPLIAGSLFGTEGGICRTPSPLCMYARFVTADGLDSLLKHIVSEWIATYLMYPGGIGAWWHGGSQDMVTCSFVRVSRPRQNKCKTMHFRSLLFVA